MQKAVRASAGTGIEIAQSLAQMHADGKIASADEAAARCVKFLRDDAHFGRQPIEDVYDLMSQNIV